MRSKRKMKTVRIRKANATIKKEKVVCNLWLQWKSWNKIQCDKNT